MNFRQLSQAIFGILWSILVFLGLVIPAWAAPFGYSVRGDEDTILYKIDLATGFQTKIGTGVGINDVEGLAFDPTSGILYGADDEDNQLITINVNTGVGTAIGPLGVANGDEEGEFGLAIDPTGTIFLFNDFTDELFFVNKNTGAATKIGATKARVDGLAFLGSTLYGVDPDAGALYTINTSTGLATLVGALGVSFETQSGLASDGTNLWGIDEGGVIIRINPTTGAAVQTASTIVGFEDLAIQQETVSTHESSHDLDGDGNADIVWRNTSSGVVAVWLMNGPTISNSGFPAGVPLVWQIAGVGDVNGDGKADVIWRNSTSGTVAVWLMNGLTITSVGFPGSTSTDWEIEQIGDVDGNGTADLVWRNTNSGVVAVWLMNGAAIASAGFLGGVPAVWQINGIGDVNSDGRADVIWRNDISGTVAVWLMNGLTISSVGFPGSATTDWQIVGMGDVDGNGTADVVWRNTNSGAVAVWLMNGATMASSGFFAGKFADWKIAQVGDVDGDGKADVIWRSSNTGMLDVWLMNGLTITSTGSPGTTPTDWEIQGGGDSNPTGVPPIPTGIPTITGVYSGTANATNTNCSDSSLNTNFTADVQVTILTQSGNVFTGQTTVELVFDGDVFSGIDQLTGTVSLTGDMTGTIVGQFEATTHAGTFSGQVRGNALSYGFSTQDTSGETCHTTGTVTATK
jgi:hypothetical protein